MKFVTALVLAAPASVVIAIIGSCQYWFSVSIPNCNCPVEKISMARLAFEYNYQATAYAWALITVVLGLLLYKIPWSKLRVAAFFAALIVAIVVWYVYVVYVWVEPNSVRWWNLPVVSLTAAPYSEITRQYVMPVLSWRFACAFLSGLGAYLLVELSGVLYLLALKSWNINAVLTGITRRKGKGGVKP